MGLFVSSILVFLMVVIFWCIGLGNCVSLVVLSNWLFRLESVIIFVWMVMCWFSCVVMVLSRFSVWEGWWLFLVMMMICRGWFMKKVFFG